MLAGYCCLSLGDSMLIQIPPSLHLTQALEPAAKSTIAVATVAAAAKAPRRAYPPAVVVVVFASVVEEGTKLRRVP